MVAAALDSSLMPELFRGPWRPQLALIVASVWAQATDTEGLVAVLVAGLSLDALSGSPFGAQTFSLMLGNAAASVLDRAPIPSPLLRATNWVTVVTLTYHVMLVATQGFRGIDVDLTYAATSIILPLLFVNPLLAIAAYGGIRLARPGLFGGRTRGA